MLLLAGCQGSSASRPGSSVHDDNRAAPEGVLPSPPPTDGQPALDVYRNDRPGNLSPVVQGMPTRVYVPNSEASTVDELDPTTNTVVRHFPTGKLPQHIVPSWDLKTL